VTPEHVLDVERDGAEALGYGRNLLWRHEQKDGRRVDEPPDEPRAGDTIDLRPRPGYPKRLAGLAWQRQGGSGHGRQSRRGPCRMPSLQCFRGDAEMAQPCGDAFAQLPAVVTDHDCRGLAEPRRPLLHAVTWLTRRAGYQARLGREILVCAHVDQRRAIGRADQA
jgi:hypothetical protein